MLHEKQLVSFESIPLPLCVQGTSETFKTLQGLVNKGVNVVMDIPYELWNETSAEVADLKKQVLSHLRYIFSQSGIDFCFGIHFNRCCFCSHFLMS